jgi:DNA-binding HxlR family transcriptional regulator
MHYVDAAVIGANTVGAGIGLIPLDGDDRVPRRATYPDLSKIELDVREKPIKSLVPLPGRRKRRSQRCGARWPGALDLMGDWWSPLIVRDLFLEVTRFDELVADLGISRNLLTRRLKSLVESGIVERKIYQLRPTRYEYRLTPAGRDLVPAILALTAWGERWARPKEGSPMVFAHKTCGHLFEPRVTCSECGELITADTVIAIPGPGGAAKAGTKIVATKILAKRLLARAR